MNPYVMITGLQTDRPIPENCVLLRYYTASSAKFLPTLRDNPSVPFSRMDSWRLKMGPISCPETSARNYHYTLRNNPEKRSYHLLRGGSLKSRKDLNLQ